MLFLSWNWDFSQCFSVDHSFYDVSVLLLNVHACCNLIFQQIDECIILVDQTFEFRHLISSLVTSEGLGMVYGAQAVFFILYSVGICCILLHQCYKCCDTEEGSLSQWDVALPSTWVWTISGAWALAAASSSILLTSQSDRVNRSLSWGSFAALVWSYYKAVICVLYLAVLMFSLG